MNYPLWFGNLAAYCLQIGAIVLVGSMAWALLRLKQARLRLAYWQVLLGACLLLPLLQPWERTGLAPAGSFATARIVLEGAGSSASPIPIYKWAFLVLVAGAGLGLVRLAMGLCRLDAYRQTARRIVKLSEALREARALVGVVPAFYVSACVEVPVTFGWHEPAIIFPTRIEAMEESQQRTIACHELLHVARRDWLHNLFEELILTVFWFHPAVRWVIRNIRLGREQVVDSRVVELTGARKPYLHALLEIASAGPASALPAPLFVGESQLAQRVALLVKEVHMSKVRLIASLVTALAALLVAGGVAIRAFPLAAPGETPVAANPVPLALSDGAAAAPALTTKHEAYKVYKVGGEVTAPVPIFKPEPPYSPAARMDKVQGVVHLEAVVDAKGNVTDVRVKKSLRRDLDENAMKTIRIWKFEPAMRKGQPVPVRVFIEVSFRFF